MKMVDREYVFPLFFRVNAGNRKGNMADKVIATDLRLLMLLRRDLSG